MEIRLDGWVKLGSGAVAALWAQTPPLVQLLIWLMVLDVFTGILAAIINRELSSTTSFLGILKKVMMLAIVVSGILLEPHVGLPVADAVAGFYCAHEVISISENAARANLPVPDVIKAVLLKLNPQAKIEPGRG